jgi:hypothetical protein
MFSSGRKLKYEPLALFLRTLPFGQKEITMSFERVEEIIEASLPKSAHKYREWWANDAHSHPQSKAWMSAGWKVKSVDLLGESVRFIRDMT